MGGRDPGMLADCAAGEPRRALLMACEADRTGDQGSGQARGLPHVHPSWWTEPALALPARARAVFAGTLPPEGRRLASAACAEAAESWAAGDDPAWMPGETLASIARMLRPPSLDRAPRPCQEGRPDRIAELISSHPVETAAITGMVARALPQGSPPAAARDLALLAAGMAGDTDQAEALALGMPRPIGLAFLIARSRWSLLLDPAENAGDGAGARSGR